MVEVEMGRKRKAGLSCVMYRSALAIAVSCVEDDIVVLC